MPQDPAKPTARPNAVAVVVAMLLLRPVTHARLHASYWSRACQLQRPCHLHKWFSEVQLCLSIAAVQPDELTPVDLVVLHQETWTLKEEWMETTLLGAKRSAPLEECMA